LRANEVFQALDGKQRSRALIEGPVPQESPSVLLSHAPEFRAGLPVEEMSRDQRELVEKVLADLMAPFNSRDVEEARRYLKANGGSRGLHMAFYKQEDLGSDGLWDVWKLEGPAMAWYFRGAPHVHVWAYLSEKPLTVPHPGPRSGA